MFADVLQRALSRFGIHYGWVMVLIAFLTTVCASAAFGLAGVLMVPITAEFGWSRTDVSSAIGLMFLLYALIAPFSGALMLSYGVSRVVGAAAALVTLSLVLLTMISERWHILVSFGLIMGTAAGMVDLGLAATIASRWFVARRGLVVGILTSAFAAGQLVLVPAAAWLATNLGWRWAVVPVLGGSLASAALISLFGRDWPGELGLPAYGETKVEPPPAGNSTGAIATSFAVLTEALPSPAFWALAGTFFICGLSSAGIVQQHFIPFCVDNNVSAIVAASYMAMMGVFNFIGTNLSGWLSDRFDNRVLLAIYYSLRGLSLIWLPFSDLSVLSLTLWAIFFGLDYVATVPPTVRITGQQFGAVKGPVLFGWIFAAHQMGSASAAFGSGVVRDSVLSYLPAFVAAGVACFVAVAMLAMIKSPPRPAVVAA